MFPITTGFHHIVLFTLSILQLAIMHTHWLELCHTTLPSESIVSGSSLRVLNTLQQVFSLINFCPQLPHGFPEGEQIPCSWLLKWLQSPLSEHLLDQVLRLAFTPLYQDPENLFSSQLWLPWQLPAVTHSQLICYSSPQQEWVPSYQTLTIHQMKCRIYCMKATLTEIELQDGMK